MKKRENYNLIIGAVIVGSLFLMMFIGLFWTPYPPNEIFPDRALMPPSFENWLGTDNFGRDIFSRIMEGAKTAFLVAFFAVGIGLVGGLIIGSISGYVGGKLDEILMRMMDVMMAVPGILFAMMLVAIFTPGLGNTILALGIPRIPSFARIVRGGFLQVKEFDFVKSSRLKGASHGHIIWHHILPNIMTQVIVVTALSFSTTILSESGLSYLGLGVTPPNPSWGRMLNEAKPYFLSAPWYIFTVGAFVTLLVFGFNLLGDGIRKRQDKREI